MKKKKTNPIPLPLRLIRWAFPKIEAVLPSLANRWGVNLFFTPFRFPVPVAEQEMADQARKFKYVVAGKHIQGYVWGEGKEAVLLVHGWAGRATQFRAFLKPLLEAGYQVIAIDGPAHGASSGKKTHLLEFEEALKNLYKLHPNISAVVTHSFGGIAALYAVRMGLPVSRVVTIGCPSVGSYIVEEFLRRINASAKVGEYFQEYIVKTLGQPFENFSVRESLRQIENIELLAIHDETDREVPLRHAKVLKEAYSSAQQLITTGLGHTRILKDASVIQHCIDFLKQDNRSQKNQESKIPNDLTFLKASTQ